jgi:hypothetical protein
MGYLGELPNASADHFGISKCYSFQKGLPQHRNLKAKANDFEPLFETEKVISRHLEGSGKKRKTNHGCLSPRISFWPYFLQLWPSPEGGSQPPSVLTLT